LWSFGGRMGRDITYDCWSCDLLCAASSPDLYRINLEQVFILQLSVLETSLVARRYLSFSIG